MPNADSGGCRIYYEIHGERGSAVLLIAGYGASIVGWHKPLVNELAAQHRVVLFDNRGVVRATSLTSRIPWPCSQTMPRRYWMHPALTMHM